MNLQMNLGSAAGYKSASQVVRKLSESWAGENLYCAACNSDSIFAMPPNARAIDFSCQRCSATYQLKATKSLTWSRIPDGSYSAMMQALRSDQIPNLFVMKYNAEFCVSDLISGLSS
jgi:type II restriction enzyme